MHEEIHFRFPTSITSLSNKCSSWRHGLELFWYTRRELCLRSFHVRLVPSRAVLTRADSSTLKILFSKTDGFCSIRLKKMFLDPSYYQQQTWLRHALSLMWGTSLRLNMFSVHRGSHLVESFYNVKISLVSC